MSLPLDRPRAIGLRVAWLDVAPWALATALSLALGLALAQTDASLAVVGGFALFMLAVAVFIRPVLVYGVWMVALPLAGDLTSLGGATNVTTGRLALALTLVAVAGECLLKSPGIRRGIVLPAAAFALASFASFTLRPLQAAGDRAAFINTILVPASAAVGIGVIRLSEREARRLVDVLPWVGGALAAVAIVQHLSHGAPAVGAGAIYRPAGQFEHPLILGSVIALASMATVEWVLTARSPARRMAGIALLSLAAVGAFYTLSRGPLVALGVGALYLVVRGARFRRIRGELVLAAALALAAVRSTLNDPLVLERLGSSRTFDTRMHLYGSAWRLFESHWLLGVGVRGFGHALGTELPSALVGVGSWFAVDNYYIDVLVQGGLLSALGLGMLLAVAIRGIVRVGDLDPVRRTGAAIVIVALTICLDFDALSYPAIAAFLVFGIRLLQPAPSASAAVAAEAAH